MPTRDRQPQAKDVRRLCFGSGTRKEVVLMWHRNVSRTIIALLALQGVLMITSAQQLFADTFARGKGPDAIHVFRGGGGARTPTPNPGPGMLNAAALKILAGQVGSTPGTVYVKLTPQSPSVTNRGALVFDSPKL